MLTSHRHPDGSYARVPFPDDTVTLTEKQLPPPPPIRFIKGLSGDPLPFDGDLKALARLLDNHRNIGVNDVAAWDIVAAWGIYEHPLWGMNYVHHQPLFVLTTATGEQVILEFASQIAQRINWVDPEVRVMFREWSDETHGYNYRCNLNKICYQTWYEHIGYTRIFDGENRVYVKHATDIPIDWVATEDRIWCSPDDFAFLSRFRSCNEAGGNDY